jgi:uncharacterized protein (TIRG00374 family)
MGRCKQPFTLLSAFDINGRMASMKRWQFWVGVLISVVFLYIALRGLKLGDVLQTMRTANYWWLIPGIAVYFLAVLARAWRWHFLVLPIKSVPTLRMFPIVCIGYMGNNIYPARAGEVLRSVILKQTDDVAISASLATIIVERIFDGVVMLGFIFVNLGELATLTHGAGVIGTVSIQDIAILGTGIFGLALLVIFLTAIFPVQASWMTNRMIKLVVPVRFRPQLEGMAEKFMSGLGSLRSPRDALMILLTTIVIWLLETGKYWFVMHAFSFHVSFYALMLMNGVVNLATTIPSAPGYIGTFDAPGIAVLSAYGVDPVIAASYTLVLHVALWLPITALGAYYLAREGIRLTEARAQYNREGIQP